MFCPLSVWQWYISYMISDPLFLSPGVRGTRLILESSFTSSRVFRPTRSHSQSVIFDATCLPDTAWVTWQYNNQKQKKGGGGTNCGGSVTCESSGSCTHSRVSSSMTSHLKCRSHCSRIDPYLYKSWYRHCDIWILHAPIRTFFKRLRWNHLNYRNVAHICFLFLFDDLDFTIKR